VKLLRGVDPKAEYWALVGNPPLLALTPSVVNDCTEDVAEMRVPATVPYSAGVKDVGGVPSELGSGRLEVDTGGKDIVKVVDGVGATNVTMTEDNAILGDLVEPDGVGRGLGGGGGGGGGGEAGLFETPVPGRGLWLVEDASSSVLVVARSGPFWFPSGPGGPFLFPSRPGAVGFAGSRTVRGSGKDGGLVGLWLLGRSIVLPSFRSDL
jgi:hypothetical protein